MRASTEGITAHLTADSLGHLGDSRRHYWARCRWEELPLRASGLDIVASCTRARYHAGRHAHPHHLRTFLVFYVHTTARCLLSSGASSCHAPLSQTRPDLSSLGGHSLPGLTRANSRLSFIFASCPAVPARCATYLDLAKTSRTLCFATVHAHVPLSRWAGASCSVRSCVRAASLPVDSSRAARNVACRTPHLPLSLTVGAHWRAATGRRCRISFARSADSAAR